MAVGDPSESLLLACEKAGADLLVLGSRGREGFVGLVLGSRGREGFVGLVLGSRGREGFVGLVLGSRGREGLSAAARVHRPGVRGACTRPVLTVHPRSTRRRRNRDREGTAAED